MGNDFESEESRDDKSLIDLEGPSNKKLKLSLGLDDIASSIREEQKLRCNHCKNYLSYFPIYLSAKQHNICGRCYDSLSQKSNYIKNQVYEDVAHMVQFPCRYRDEGCLENLLPADIPAHENICSYRVVQCLTADFTDCMWEGALPNLLRHCQDKHSDLILVNGEFKLDLANSHLCSNILEYESTLFVITRQYCCVNKKLEISVCNIETQANKGEFLYEINFTNSNRNVIVNCKTTPLDQKKIEEIFLDSLKDKNNESIVTARITVENKRNEPEQNLLHNDQNNKAMLAILKCSFCDGYALPPIYEVNISGCAESRITCSDCRGRYRTDKLIVIRPSTTPGQSSTNLYVSPDSISNSKMGRQIIKTTTTTTQNNSQNKVDFGGKTFTTAVFGPRHTRIINEVRNYNLDKLANLLFYPCKYERNGCNFVLKPSEMEQHLTSCLYYGSYCCPFNKLKDCPWTGLGKDVTAHVETHQDIIIDNSAEISEFVFKLNGNGENDFDLISFQRVKCFVIKFSNKLFKLCYSEKENKIYWVVQMIGQFEDTFLYELEIINKNIRNQNLIIRQRCLSLTYDSQIFKQPNTIYFHSDQLEPFVLNNKLTFKVKIFK